jgi:hypothetical protein
MSDVFAGIEAVYKAKVMGDTWGHLAPKKNTTYRGRIVCAVGCFGNDHLNPTPLICEFNNLESSPWFFNAMGDFIGSQKFESGCVYEFKGTFRNYVFKGTIALVKNFN